LSFAGAVFLVKASTQSTSGAFAIIEEVDPLDTPLHVHANEDELFYVIEGEHVFRVGEEEFPAGPGARPGSRDSFESSAPPRVREERDGSPTRERRRSMGSPG
jgi:Cupin domain